MYKRLFLPILFFFSLVSITVKAQNSDPYMGLIPAPVSVKKLSGDFMLSQQTTLVADSVTNKAVVFLTGYFKSKTGLTITPQPYTGQLINNGIIITSAGSDAL